MASILVCTTCGQRYKAPAKKPAKPLRCRKDGGALAAEKAKGARPERRSGKSPVLVGAIGAVALLGAVGFFLFRGGGAAEEAPVAVVPAPELTGKELYQKGCASCHGARGEGTREYSDPLIGKWSLEKLTKFIDRKMPEDKPELCKGEDAEKVAAFIYDAFYSPDAQLRNRPPRVDLVRLTNGQYRNAVADLVATFSNPRPWGDKRGIRTEITGKGRDARHTRIDKVIDVDFGNTAPADKVQPEEYTVRWSGGVFAPDTGEYEFILETPNGTRLWVNDREKPLIDRWARSGNETRYARSIFLLGGRVYPLQLEIKKAKAKDAKNNEKQAAMTLKWRRPARVEEVLPEAHLSPESFPEQLIVRTSFPPDDGSMGYERGTSVSREWDEAATYAALEVAEYLSTRTELLMGGRFKGDEAKKRLRQGCHRLAERAFRRPLTDEQKKTLVDRHFDGTGGKDADAVKRVVLFVLKSPRFLFPEAGSEKPDAWDVATRISMGLWDSLPDATLLEAAKAGKLSTREEIAAQVTRMLPDPRTRVKVREFFHLYLQLDHLSGLVKNPELFPEFNEEVIADLRTSLDLFVDGVVWSRESDFRQLMMSDSVPLNGRLAKFYGVGAKEGAEFKPVRFEPGKRSGMLTHPLVMAGYSHDATTSPIHRGVWIARFLLGRKLRPPPDAVAPDPPDLHPGLTTRQRIEQQTKPKICSGCHVMINPLGFTLENFDAVGRFREKDGERSIDASGAYESLSGQGVEFGSARDLGAYLAKSEESQRAFIQRLHHHLVKQPVMAYGREHDDRLYRAFSGKGFSIRELIVEIVASSAPSPRTISEEKQP